MNTNCSDVIETSKITLDYHVTRPKFDFSRSTLYGLESAYDLVDQQSHLIKGIILLEAKRRFKSNNEFGDWCKSVQSICLDSQKSRNRFMHLANYFKDKDYDGILLSSCYAISQPSNRDVADAVYEQAYRQDLSLEEVEDLIRIQKELIGASDINPKLSSPTSSPSEPSPKPESLSKSAQKVLRFLHKSELPTDQMIDLLYGYIYSLEKKRDEEMKEVPDQNAE